MPIDFDKVDIADKMLDALSIHKYQLVIKALTPGSAMVFMPTLKNKNKKIISNSLDQSYMVQILKTLRERNLIIRHTLEKGRKKYSYKINYPVMAKVIDFVEKINSLENEKNELE